MDLLWLVLLGFGTGAYGVLVGAGGGFILGPVLLYMTAFFIAWRYPLTAARQERIHGWVVRREARLSVTAVSR